MQKKTLLIAASALVLATAPAQARRAWLAPSATVLADTSSWITVDAAVSDTLYTADSFPLAIDAIQVWQPDGTPGKVENPAKGHNRSTFDIQINQLGTWKVGLADSTVSGTFKVNGEDWAVGRRRGGMGGGAGPGGQRPAGEAGQRPGGEGGQRPQAGGPPAGPGGPGGPGGGEGGPPRQMIPPEHMVATVADIPPGATDFNLTESQTRNEFFVTAGNSTTTVFATTGKGLEMVPVTHPDELVSNEPAKFRFLIDGKPAGNIKVSVIPGGKLFRADEQEQDLTTGADGSLTVKWPVAGYYWLNATATDDKATAPHATKRRLSYIATLEVVAP